MYIKSKHHIEDTMKFILIYSYYTDKANSEIALNQNAIAKFLNINKRSVIRHFEKIKSMGLITITGKTKFTTNKNSRWYSNLYYIDQEALNNYLIIHTGYDIIENIVEEEHIYYDFLLSIKSTYEENKMNELTEDEKEKYLNRLKNKAKKEQEKLDQLKKDNTFYLDLLEEVNNEYIPMRYLNDNRKRLVSSICTTKNPDNPGHENDTVRISMLSKFFNTNEKIVEFDTNASIYRLSYALGNNNIANHNIDIYKLVYDECNFDVEWSSELRNHFKKLLMPIYMLERSIGYKCIEYEKHSKWKYFISKEVKEEFLFYKYFVDIFKMDLKTILTTIKNAMHKVFNMDKFYQANIFIHESNLHIIMLKIFKDMGIKTIDVYDGFYFIDGTMNQYLYDEIYDKATNILLNNLNREEKSLDVA